MKVTLLQAEKIIAAHTDLIGSYYLMPDGDEMKIQEFRVLAVPTGKNKEIYYSVIALVQTPDKSNGVQLFASFENIIAQLEVPFDVKKY